MMKLSKDQFTFLFAAFMDRPPRVDEVDSYYPRCGGEAHEAVCLIWQIEEFAAKHPTLTPNLPAETSATIMLHRAEIAAPGMERAGTTTAQDIDDEPWIAAAMRQILRPGSVFLDVGAHFGRHTMLGAQLVGPTGRVFALEADLELAAILQANSRHGRFGNVVVVPRAVADQKRVEFITVGYGTGDLPVQREEIAKQKYTFEPILMDTLDSALGHLDRVDLIRIDLRGHEGAALKGAERLLSRRPMVVARYAFDSEESGFVDRLIEQNYEMTAISCGAPVRLGGGDVQALRDRGGDGAARYVDIVFSPREAAFRLVDTRPRNIVLNATDPRLATQIGQRENGILRIEAPGAETERHYAMFGPYLSLPSGSYRAAVDMTIVSGGDGAILDVCHRRGAIVLAAAEAWGGIVDFALTDAATDLEIRLQVPGGFRGVVRQISVRAHDVDQPEG